MLTPVPCVQFFGRMNAIKAPWLLAARFNVYSESGHTRGIVPSEEVLSTWNKGFFPVLLFFDLQEI